MSRRVKRADYRVWLDNKVTGIVLLQYSDREVDEYVTTMSKHPLVSTVSFSHYDRKKNK